MSVLVIDTDPIIHQVVAEVCEQAAVALHRARTGRDALRLIEDVRPILAVLDPDLPDMDGLDLLRTVHRYLPVILFTRRGRTLDQVLGFELGAFDYIVKPADPDIAQARIRAALRRVQYTPWSNHDIVRAGDLSVDPAGQVAYVGEETIRLRPREAALLAALARAAGELVTTEQLLETVWGEYYEGEPQVLYVHIRWLREKIEIDPSKPSRILTVRNLGYRLVPRHSEGAHRQEIGRPPTLTDR